MRTKFNKKLSLEQWNVLMTIALDSHLSDWFELRGNDVHDWCYDRENGLALSLRKAITELDDCLTDDDYFLLGQYGRKVYDGCLEQFGITKQQRVKCGMGTVRHCKKDFQREKIRLWAIIKTGIFS